MIPKNSGGCFLLYVYSATLTAIGFCQTGKLSIMGIVFSIGMFYLGHSYASEATSDPAADQCE